jgi:antitoxin ParD1/3/4
MSSPAAAVIEQRHPMSLNLPPEFERAILERVRSGAYESTDDVLKVCLEALALLESALAEDHEWLRREIQIGIDELDRGEGIPREQAIERLRAEVRRRTGR